MWLSLLFALLPSLARWRLLRQPLCKVANANPFTALGCSAVSASVCKRSSSLSFSPSVSVSPLLWLVQALGVLFGTLSLGFCAWGRIVSFALAVAAGFLEKVCQSLGGPGFLCWACLFYSFGGFSLSGRVFWRLKACLRAAGLVCSVSVPFPFLAALLGVSGWLGAGSGGIRHRVGRRAAKVLPAPPHSGSLRGGGGSQEQDLLKLFTEVLSKFAAPDDTEKGNFGKGISHGKKGRSPKQSFTDQPSKGSTGKADVDSPIHNNERCWTRLRDEWTEPRRITEQDSCSDCMGLWLLQTTAKLLGPKDLSGKVRNRKRLFPLKPPRVAPKVRLRVRGRVT